MSSNSNLKAALDYTGRGWPVLPVWWIQEGRCACGNADCQHPGKHPLGKLAPKGRNSATTDPQIIKKWWRQFPTANIGVLTGPESGLVVGDVDPRHGGIESCKRVGRLGNFPYTPMARTGGDGDHILMQHPGAGRKIKSRSLPGYPGIDIKGDGGYIVVAPSNHISGKNYSWAIDPDTPLAKIPDWLMPLLQDDAPPRQSAKRVERKIPERKRSSTLTSLAGSMRRRGMLQEAIEAALLVENRRCDPPLPEAEVLSIAKSISRYEPKPEGGQEPKLTQVDILLTLAAAAELFHTPDDEGYARVPVNGHTESWSIRSMGFRHWLTHAFYKKAGKGCHGEALQTALQLLEAKAQFDGPERPVWVRVAEHEGNIYIDLGNPVWEAIEITPRGWRVVAAPPVCFRRSKSMLPLPNPERGGNVKELRNFLNVASDYDFYLMVAGLLAEMRAQGPYPITVLNGGEGTAKSTMARVNRSLTDPNTSPLRSAPRDESALMIAATNSWVLAYDNLSGIPKWLSDAYCRLSTGGGISGRELYTDKGENILDATRPVILNGIDSLTERQDLASRALIFNLPRISKKDRRAEKEFWAAFEKARPRIIGALLDAVSVGLKNLESVRLPFLPRMADFALWIVACEPALPWPSGSFMAAYASNRQEAIELSLEADVVAMAVRAYMADKDEWSGAPSELHGVLENHVQENIRKNNAWPRAAHRLSNRLKRAATFLREVGVEIEFSKSGTRKITITRQGKKSSVQSVQSAQAKENQEVSLGAFQNRSAQPGASSAQEETGARVLDASLGGLDASQKVASSRKAHNHAGLDDMDASDAPLRTLMGDTPRLAAWDRPIGQVVEGALKALAPGEDEDAKELAGGVL